MRVSNCEPRSLAATLLASIWKFIAALSRPLSMTMRCKPICTIVASNCWRLRASTCWASGTRRSGSAAVTASPGPNPSAVRSAASAGGVAPARNASRVDASRSACSSCWRWRRSSGGRPASSSASSAASSSPVTS
ncbi:hypothetical protein DIE20_03755 [Burkholderia sp. Bp9131]|nr:hypothetical protein DIE20_03755 [Burkholderia sp. Bp9131]RQR81678.1 hypothetical protein DIE10_17180 [Burkholderia sp. Bp9011]